MKRILTAIAAVLIVLAAAATAVGWLIGTRSQDAYEAALAELNGQVVGLRLESTSYDRGFFTTRARTVAHLEQDELVFEHRIVHLPLPRVRVETRVVPGEGVRNLLADQGLESLLESPVVTEVDLSGKSRTSYVIAGFSRELTRQSGEKVSVKCQGLSLTINLSADLKGASGRLNFPYLRVDGDGSLLEIEGINSEFETSRQQGLATGQSHMTMDVFRFELDQQQKYASLALRDLKTSSRNGINGEFYGGSMRLDAGELMLSGRSYGPLAMELALENLAVSPLQRLQEELEKFNQSASGDPQQAQMTFLLAMAEIVPELLGSQPRFALRTLSLDGGEQGKLAGEGEVYFAGTTGSPDPQQLIAGLVAHLDLSLSRSLLQSLIMSVQYLQAERRAGVDEQFDGMISQVADSAIEQLKERRILLEEGDRMLLNMQLEQLQLTLNGEPLPLPL